MIRLFFLRVLGAILLLPFLSLARAEVKVSSLFSDHMVLQQGRENPVWGTAKPGEKITVSMNGSAVETVAGADGKWLVRLGPLQKTSTPVTLSIKGENEIVIQDVLVGEVWLCSGQSNMAFNLKKAHNAAKVLPKADHPEMRFFQVQQGLSFTPEENVKGKWIVCTPETAGDASAAGYFFGEQILQTQKTPVGLIQSYVGGTPAEAWTSLQALQAVPTLEHYARKFEKTKANLPALMKEYEEGPLAKWNVAMAEWKAKNEAAGTADKKPEVKKSRAERGPKKPPAPDNDSDLPTVLFNGKIAPLIPYGIKGVIWYQGEANVRNAEEYATLFPAMIQDWRSRWGEGDFPFLFVQLASFGKSAKFHLLRNAQLQTLAVPNTGMAVAIDIGEENDIHPLNKLDVGLRLALAARAIAYGEKVVYSGPIFKSMAVENGKARVTFDHVGGGLVIGSAPPIRMDEQPKAPADRLLGFEIAGKDGNFTAAQAEIKGDEVLVWSETVKEPAAVRYGWAPFPELNLYNKEGLPASPFTSVGAR